ncbi:hypothetical protein Q7C_2061 [Methylophaga frappieri]|uniref:Uncharacterized protein n=1 Tax=Methylophaga frappieri (strain ATCC BAA-2434 / DSM 25690 / JAM7) TaxID=754477 RepID=I1YJV7_METFJ|nr:hypothetical protein Q7C_2061 [Methylophaga frappieri]
MNWEIVNINNYLAKNNGLHFGQCYPAWQRVCYSQPRCLPVCFVLTMQGVLIVEYAGFLNFQLKFSWTR